jgi:hypothetical protein
VTNYCPVLDRFIGKNPGYAALVDSGNPGNCLKAAVMPWVYPNVAEVAPQPFTFQANQRKDAA